jgi:molybdopterin-guanine dinucleotide biosynthesis protein A
MRRADSAIILAGGKSSRMGFDKNQLVIDGVRLVDILSTALLSLFAEVILVNNSPDFSPPDGVLVVSDELSGMGPLGGIHAGLKAAHSQYCLVTACDMPNINLDYVKFMRELLLEPGMDVTVLATRYRPHMEPFTAFYSRNLIRPIEDYCRGGGRGLNAFLSKQGVTLIEECVARRFSPEWSMFANLNTPEEHRQYLLSR